MNRKTIGTLLIAGLIAVALFVGTAAANGVPHIYASDEFGCYKYQYTFDTTDHVYAYGHFGCWDYPSDSARVYVVQYKDSGIEGDVLEDVSDDGYETVVCGSWGNFFTEDPVWNAPLKPGDYQLVLD